MHTKIVVDVSQQKLLLKPTRPNKLEGLIMKDRLILLAVTLVGIALVADWTASRSVWVVVAYVAIGVVVSFKASYKVRPGNSWVIDFALLVPCWVIFATIVSVISWLPGYKEFGVTKLMRGDG